MGFCKRQTDGAVKTGIGKRGRAEIENGGYAVTPKRSKEAKRGS